VLQNAGTGGRIGEVRKLERHRGWEDHHPTPPPVAVPGTTTATTVTPSPDGDHRETTIHKEVDRKGNTVIEKDVHREGIAGSTDTHTKTETDRDGGSTTTTETTTKPR